MPDKLADDVPRNGNCHGSRLIIIAVPLGSAQIDRRGDGGEEGPTAARVHTIDKFEIADHSNQNETPDEAEGDCDPDGVKNDAYLRVRVVCRPLAAAWSHGQRAVLPIMDATETTARDDSDSSSSSTCGSCVDGV